MRRAPAVGACRSPARSFDHLVGTSEERRRHDKTERLGGPKIDHEFDPCRHLHRQIAWSFASKDAASVNADLAIRLGEASTVADQAAGNGILVDGVDCGNPMAGGQCHDLIASGEKDGVGADDQSASPLLDKIGESSVDLAFVAGTEAENSSSHGS